VCAAVLAVLLLARGVQPARADDEKGSASLARFLAYMTDPGPLSKTHQSLGGTCESCHTPFKGLDSGKCVACHASETVLLSRQPTAFHATIGTCTGCHVEHLGQDVRPTTMDHDELARALASVAPRGDTSNRIDPAARRLDCNQCHSNQDRHRGLFGSDCSECHGTERWQVAGYRHPSPESRDCVQCHTAPPSHYMEHFSMVSEKAVGMEHVDVRHCYLCHETTAWNDIRGVGWYKHH
jgi:hypothetical protein